jgi:hypothetical protein
MMRDRLTLTDRERLKKGDGIEPIPSIGGLSDCYHCSIPLKKNPPSIRAFSSLSLP